MTLETLAALAVSILSNMGKAAAGAVALAGVYASLGGPIPATRTYVDAAVKSLTVDSLDNRRSVIRLSRFFLGSEEAAIGKTVDALIEGPNKAILERRRREIQNALKDLDEDDDQARARLRELQK